MIQTLQQAAKTAPDAIRCDLMLVAAEMAHAIQAFEEKPTAAGLELMVGHWSHGVRLMKNARDHQKGTTPCPNPMNATAETAPPTIC